MTYAQLIAAIQSYVENTFPATYLADGSTVSSTTQLNTFITQAEQRIFNTVQFPSLRRNVTGFTTTSNKYLACPADFLAAYSMAVIDASGNYEYLLNKDVNFIRQAYPQPTDIATPKYYALFGPSYTNSDELSFILGPTPDAVYSVELHYFFYPDSITIAPDGRTWLGDNFDSVLLYGSLVEAYTFMKGEADIIAGYDMKYKEALALAQRLGDGLERSDAYRSGQFRVPPLAQNNGVR
jgi:hypothetical protein